MVASAANEAIAPPGMPGVPTDKITFASRITIIMEVLTSTPQALAKNTIMNDNTMETASMLTVAPRGIAILVILSDTPISSSMHCLLRGMVAELEQVPKAFKAAGNQRRAAAKERIKDDAICQVSDRILAEIEDNHMRERDTKIGLAEQRQVAFLEIAFQILPLKSKQKRAP